MKIAIIHHVSGESAKLLKEWLEEDGHDVVIGRPYKDGQTNYTGRYVISLGCSLDTKDAGRINSTSAVLTCVDKVKTLRQLKDARVSTVKWCTHYTEVSKKWETIVVRESATGCRAEGISYISKGGFIPRDKALYTEYYVHRREYRVVVLKGKAVGVYHKHSKDGSWWFNLRPSDGFEKIIKQCEKAAKQIGIDYVGFDVVAKDKKDFAILEANSGAVITPEAAQAFCKLFKGK